MRARIFRPARTAMQSGLAKTHEWVLEFQPSEAKRRDPLMGWSGSGDMLGTQVRLTFETREAAIAYAEAQGLAFDVELPPAPHPRKPKSYADNFRADRRENWTH